MTSPAPSSTVPILDSAAFGKGGGGGSGDSGISSEGHPRNVAQEMMSS